MHERCNESTNMGRGSHGCSVTRISNQILPVLTLAQGIWPQDYLLRALHPHTYSLFPRTQPSFSFTCSVVKWDSTAAMGTSAAWKEAWERGYPCPKQANYLCHELSTLHPPPQTRDSVFGLTDYINFTSVGILQHFGA